MHFIYVYFQNRKMDDPVYKYRYKIECAQIWAKVLNEKKQFSRNPQ